MSPKPDSADADSTVRPSVFLDYGADGAAGEDSICEVCQRGMRFRSRWQFEPGTVMSIAFRFGEDGCRRLEVEGMVIECGQAGDREYVTTLAFVEVPGELRAVLGEVGCRFDAKPVSNGHPRGLRHLR